MNNIKDSNFVYPEFIDLLNKLVKIEINYGLSGGQIYVIKDGKEIFENNFGYINRYVNKCNLDGDIIFGEHYLIGKEDLVSVTSNTLFDMASNTKMFAGVLSVMFLVSKGLISLDTLVSEILTDYTKFANDKGEKEKITVGMLLSHTAGYISDPKYHIDGDCIDMYSKVMNTKLSRESNCESVYSDVDYILITFIVEKITSMKFDDFLEKEIYSKINLKDIMFNPLSKGISKNNIAATELNGNTRAGNRLFRNARKDIVHGQVHDGKSYYCMSGVSAHAGLFSTSKNIAKLSYDLIVSENELISRETLNEFISRIDLKFSQTKGGWRRQDHVNKDSYVWFSEFASDKTIGHTGWTGTNTHIDLENNLVISLNTNRRNCPIDSKTGEFISSDLHISNYHIVSELVYRALGLADNIGIEIYMYEKIKKLTENYCIDLSKKSLSYRNSIRVFLELLNTLSTKYSSLNKLNLSDEIVKLKNDLLLYEFEDFSYFRMEEK